MEARPDVEPAPSRLVQMSTRQANADLFRHRADLVDGIEKFALKAT
jgi:hypothetical protein